MINPKELALAGYLTESEIRKRRWWRCKTWINSEIFYFDEYIISDRAEVMRVVASKNKTNPSKAGRLLRLKPGGNGYFQVGLYNDRERGTNRMVFIHRLMYHSAKGKVPEEKEVNHKKANKSFNHLSNLEIVSHAENMVHAYRIGRYYDSHRTRMVAKTVKEARRLYLTGKYFQKELAEKYGVSISTMARLLRCETWTHV